MKVPLSWLREFVDITIPAHELAEKLSVAGLEVEQMQYIGLPRPHGIKNAPSDAPEVEWARDKFFVAQILEIKPHPNADRLTLAIVDYGKGEPIQVVTGAPNIKVSERGMKVAFVLEGARLYDGHATGWELMTLKRAKIRGIESGSMVCSEKELAISAEHEGIILLPDDAPVGAPLADYLGDVILDVKINPNMARCASIIGVAREVAALTGKKLKMPTLNVLARGAAIAGQLEIVIENPELNPRFTAALIRGVEIKPSPFWIQHRLKLAGVRAINNIVDVTNYVMLETGQPLHAFDYDKLVGRAQGSAPTIITRLPKPGETIETLDGVKRQLDPFTILVCDARGALSLGGVMGGAESEVSAQSKNILLEAAAWNYLNIRRTMQAQHLASEAGFRFSRGIHPAQAIVGLKRAIEMMRQLGGGEIARGVIDEYPRKPKKIVIDLPVAEVKRLLGVEIPVKEIVRILESLEFQVSSPKSHVPSSKSKVRGRSTSLATRHPSLHITVPDHRLDVDGADDLIEEIARVYGYARIPISRMNDELPPQRANVELDQEELARDILIDAGLQDVVSYALTTPEREAMLIPFDERATTRAAPTNAARDYVRIENPISAERVAMRQSLTASLLELVGANLRYRPRVNMFEIGLVYWGRRKGDALLLRELASELPGDDALPLERRRLGIALTGARDESAWQKNDSAPQDFYDLKGVVETLLAGLRIQNAAFTPTGHPSFHPGRAAELKLGEAVIGVFGELHPVVREKFDLPAQAVLVGEFDLDALFARVPPAQPLRALSRFPAIAQDLALIVDENIAAERVHALIAQTGGALLQRVALFDLYRGEPIPRGKKSLAYQLTFQADDRTLSDADASKLREKIVQRVRKEIGAEVRGG
ncbi:MAG: phenylalanine--tRNA ligase subunit beta [Chloroflexi bacterium]|nr:phenylalanine--tRNA ligase subunit beta [Chloroflexota bacterium]